MLSGWIFSHHVDMGFRFAIALDYSLDIVNIISIKSGKGFLDFKDTFCVTYVFGSLSEFKTVDSNYFIFPFLFLFVISILLLFLETED